MAQKVICVSISAGDKEFMRTAFLSPSRLLQERITQIRDDTSPAIKKNLEEQRRQNENLSKKINYMQNMITKYGDAVTKKYGEKALDELIGEL